MRGWALALLAACVGVWRIGDGAEWPYGRYKFLGDRSPTSTKVNDFGWGMRGPIHISHGRRSDDGPPVVQRYQIYVFKGSYSEVAKAAKEELISAGGVLRGGVQGTQIEMNDDLTVDVSPGKYDHSTGLTEDVAGWVRVDVIVSRRDSYALRWLRNLVP